MKKAEKIAEAKAVLAEAQRVGCVVSLSDCGGHISIKPPVLEIDWVLRANKVTDQIKALLKERSI